MPLELPHVFHLAIIKAIIALLPLYMLFAGSAVLFYQDKGAYSLLQLIGAG